MMVPGTAANMDCWASNVEVMPLSDTLYLSTMILFKFGLTLDCRGGDLNE